MKKYTALILAILVFCTAFTACTTKYKDAEIITMVDGEVAAMTEEGGDLERDEKGRIIVYVTDENGNVLKDENGNPLTSAVNLTHAVAIGNRIEYSLFSVEITNGWESGKLYDEVVINSTDKNQNNKIVIYSEKKADDKNKNMPGSKLFEAVKADKKIKINDVKSADITLAGVKASRQIVKLTSDVIETKVLAYYSFESEDANYGVICYSKDAKATEKTFEDVLNTMILY